MSKHTDEITAQEIEKIIMLVMNGGATLKEINNTPDDTLEHIYAHAYQYYTDGKLDEAERFFKFLCMYDLKNPDYFIGLGAVYQLKKQYSRACDIYSLAYVMSENNFLPVFFAGQCQLLMGSAGKALQCFDIICSRCTDASLVNKAKAYMDIIKSNHNGGENSGDDDASLPDKDTVNS